MRWRRLAALAVALGTAGAPAAAPANPLDLFGFGPRAAALASACSAHCTDVAATYYNPGALAAVDEVELSVGYTAATPRLSLNGVAQQVDAARGLLAGAVVPGRAWSRRFAFGVGVFLPDRRLTRVRSVAPHLPRFVLFDNKPQRLFVSAHLAVEPAEGLQIGGGLTYMAATRGTVGFAGEVYVPDPEVEHTDLDATVDVTLEAVRYPSAGVRWEPGLAWARARGLALALSWRAEFALDIDITTAVTGDLVLLAGDTELLRDEAASFRLRSRSTVLYSPEQWTLGGALDVAPGWTLVTDLVWSRWSGFVSPAASVDPSLELNIMPNAQALFPPAAPAEDPGFHDTVSPRVGVERAVALGGEHRLLLRAGYAYEPTPAPVPTGQLNLVDSDRHVGSVGAGLELGGPLGPVRGPLTLEAHGALMRLDSLDVHKDDPADRVGDYRAAGWVWTAGLWTRARF